MKETRSDRDVSAEGVLGRKVWAEDMERDKSQRPHGSEATTSFFGKRMPIAAAIVCIAAVSLLGAGCSGGPAHAPATASGPVPTTAVPLPEPTLSSPPESDSLPESSPPSDASREIRLVYGNVASALDEYPVEVDRIEAVRVAKSSANVKRTIETGEFGNYAIYTKKADPDDFLLYAGKEIPGNADELFEIGPIGVEVYLDDVLLSESNLFGETRLRIFGPCGANCVMNTWIRFEDDKHGVPVSDFRLQAHASEADLDGDGVPEVVANETSIVGKVQIYKAIDGQVVYADVNQALGAEYPSSVSYNEQLRTFTAFFPERTLTYRYEQGEEALILEEETFLDTDAEIRTKLP